MIRFAQSQKWEACWTHTVCKKKIVKKNREINLQNDSLEESEQTKYIISQNLCKNIVRVKFCNFHTVYHLELLAVENYVNMVH